MVRIDNVNVYGLDRAVVASGFSFHVGNDVKSTRKMTPHDIERGIRLGNAPEGSGHSGYLKGIIVQFDITYPQYWSMEFQRYHFAEIVMSTSKMHTLHKFAYLPYEEFAKCFSKYVDRDIIERVQNYARAYDVAPKEKKYEFMMKMLSNLPVGFELTMMVTTNYEQLKTIFNQRKDHRLKEDWGEFCAFCLGLPRFSELTGCKI